MGKKDLLLSIGLIVLMILNISLYSNKVLTPNVKNDEIKKQYEENYEQYKKQKEEEKRQETESNALSEEEIEKDRITDLKSKGEADRMYTYFNTYITYVQGGYYEEAYSKLYEDFKAQYYPTLEDYTNYVKQRYPQFLGIEYASIERQGEYYILTVNITDTLATENFLTLQQKFVIHEKGINDFEISFQVM